MESSSVYFSILLKKTSFYLRKLQNESSLWLATFTSPRWAFGYSGEENLHCNEKKPPADPEPGHLPWPTWFKKIKQIDSHTQKPPQNPDVKGKYKV